MKVLWWLVLLTLPVWAQVGSLSPLEDSPLEVQNLDFHYRLKAPEGSVELRAVVTNPGQQTARGSFLLVSQSRHIKLLADRQPLVLETVEKGSYYGHGFTLELEPGASVGLQSELLVEGEPVTAERGRGYAFQAKFPEAEQVQVLVDGPSWLWVQGLEVVAPGRWAGQPSGGKSFGFSLGPQFEVGLLVGFGLPLTLSLLAGLFHYCRGSSMGLTLVTTGSLAGLLYGLASHHSLFVWSTDPTRWPLLVTLSLAAVPAAGALASAQEAG